MKLIKFITIFVFIAIVFLNDVFADVEIKKIEVIQIQIKYELSLQCEDFLSSLAISLLGLGSGFLKDSKEIIWQEIFTFDNQRLIKKELKIKNFQKTLFYLSTNENQYFGTIFFEQQKELDRDLILNLFSLLEFLEGKLELGEEFSFPILNGKKVYKLLGKVSGFNNCEINNVNCASALLFIDIFDNKDKKIINIKANISKEQRLNGKIINIKIKTLFWPHIIATLSIKE